MNEGESVLMAWALFLLVVNPVVGGLIGSARGRTGTGAALGFALGFIGWAITGCMTDVRVPAVAPPTCPDCHGKLPDRSVKKCLHCGSAVKIPPLPEPRKVQLARWEKILGLQVPPGCVELPPLR